MKLGLAEYVHICNPSTWKGDAGGPIVQGQPRLHDNLLWKKKKRLSTQEKYVFVITCK